MGLVGWALQQICTVSQISKHFLTNLYNIFNSFTGYQYQETVLRYKMQTKKNALASKIPRILPKMWKEMTSVFRLFKGNAKKGKRSAARSLQTHIGCLPADAQWTEWCVMWSRLENERIEDQSIQNICSYIL